MKYDIHLLAGPVNRAAGSHVYHVELSRRLAARGHRITIICFDALPEVREWARVFEMPTRRYQDERFVWRFASLLRYRDLNRAVASVGCTPADLVIGGEHLFLKGYKRRFPSTPMIYSPYSPVIDVEFAHYDLAPMQRRVSSLLYCHLQRWALDHASCTVRFTQGACRLLTDRYRLRTIPRFVVNPPGLDMPDGGEGRVDTDEVRLLTVGRVVWLKGIDIALSSLKGLRHLRWRYDIVGGGAAREDLERLAAEYGLGDRVHFHGFQPDLDGWYRNADLFLFPSRCEGFGLVLLDAMSYGVPCLGIRSDGVRFWNVSDEIIDHDRTGLLADGEADFDHRLESALRDPDRLRVLGRAAHQHVASHYSWERHLDRYEELFDELVGGRRPASSRAGELIA